MIAVAQHMWVKHTITKVEILADTDGSPIVMVDPEQQALAEEDAVYGCQVCNEPLIASFHTECGGPDTESF